MKSIQTFGSFIRNTLNHPARVALFCGLFFVASVVLNGSIFRVWSLNRDLVQLQKMSVETNAGIRQIEVQLRQAKDPVYIERQARDKLDMVNEDDLVFVFSENL